MKSYSFVFVFLMSAAMGLAAEEYHSLCPQPKFSPDEKFIAFWDSEPIGGYDHKNTLKIFTIDTGQTAIIAERMFRDADIIGTADSEDPGYYECLNWSPDGRTIAFALNVKDVEFYDTQTQKVVASLNLCREACAGVRLGWITEKESVYFKERARCYGYFRIEWLDPNSVLVGYTSEVSPHEWTSSTYGVIEKANGSFRIRQAVLPADAAIYKTLIEEEEGTDVLIVETTPTGEVSVVRRKEYDFSYTSEWLIAARENSLEKNVISFSRTGALAVVCSNSDPAPDGNPYNNKISSELIRIPPAFRPVFLKMREESKERY